tara:strand:+ start:32 stop:688 length:657 start_codon:yes stop_codon:yes gene_type:complete
VGLVEEEMTRINELRQRLGRIGEDIDRNVDFQSDYAIDKTLSNMSLSELGNIRDVDNPIIGEPKRWNKKERDIIKTPTYKGDRVSNIEGPSNKYGLKRREMKNLKLHLDKGKSTADPDYNMGITQKYYDQSTTRPRYPKERIVEQWGLYGPIKDNLWRDDPTGADMIINFDEIFKATAPHDNIAEIVDSLTERKKRGKPKTRKKSGKLKQRLARIYES